ncbi:acyltransferase family protein [Candidatus Latescibacterota bacterium]
MSSQTGIQPSGRIVSIDALRGFDMFWIIGGGWFFQRLFRLFDNTVIDTLRLQLYHSRWHGFTFEDLIFPLFLFIVGVCMPFSITKRLDRGVSRASLYRHILTRTFLLILLGLIYNGLLGFRFDSMRYVGVLQRIGICYFITALILMNTRVRGQVYWTAGILLGYWAIMKLVPVPGYGSGVLTPAGNLASYIDQHFLPGQFCCFRYGDNEGLLSTIPAVATALSGVLCGHWIMGSASSVKKVYGLLAAGVVSLVAALVWDIVFPVNKLLWTSSYVLFAGGWSMLLLGAFYWIIDYRGWRAWAFPFIVIGLNPITIYVAQGVFDFGTIANIFIHGFIDNLGNFEPVFYAGSVLTVKWLFLYFLYRHKIFLKV